MQTTEFIWQNGEFKPWQEATTHVLSHTLHYGGGAFEGIRLYKTKTNSAIFRLPEHLDRLYYSAKALNINIPYQPSKLAEVMQNLIKKNNLLEGYIRPLVYFGYGALGVNATNNPIEVVIACWPWGNYLKHDRVDVKTSSYIRLHPRSTVTDAKLCGNYLNSQLASLEIANTHYHEVLLLDADNYISEGGGENIFLVKDNNLYTPKLGNILAGITRDTVFKIAKKRNITIIETSLTQADVFNADEAFFTGTAAEISPIRSLDDKVIGEDKLGAITHLIQQAYADIIHGRDADFSEYLTYID